MSYYLNTCYGQRAHVTVELGKGVAMTLHCEGSMAHYREKGGTDGWVWPDSPHHSTLKLNGTVIEFEWPEREEDAGQ